MNTKTRESTQEGSTYMIQQINIHHSIATFTEPISICPRRINFFYGSNGSGKTTLSNILGQDSYSANCTLTWEGGKKLPVLVYNKKFVNDNFVANKTISGIFTLGKDSREAQEFISEHRQEASKCAEAVATHTRSKDRLTEEIARLTSEFEETCWTVQQKYGAKFSEALSGYRGSKRSFCVKCLKEYPNMDEDNLPNIEDIEELYSVVFRRERETYSIYNEIDTSAISKNEECSLLGKRISGSVETPIGEFIEFLQNSDWVKQGVSYARLLDGKCPYCQQTLSPTIQQDIEAFFDDAYKKECALVESFKRQYESFTNVLLLQLKRISDNPIKVLNYELFKSEVKTLAAVIDANKKIIQDKIDSPATEVFIESMVPTVKRINMIIAGYNMEIRRNNEIVQNQSNEKERCRRLLWQYFTYELRTSIQQYRRNVEGKRCGISNLTSRIEECSKEETSHRRLIAQKEETLASVAPTVSAINGILKRFGFEGFRLAENSSEKATYKIIRPDGSDAKETLSEGEYKFITFLYFYHLAYGSKDKTNTITDRGVVIDDPISSLDSNTLFIISTLVRTLLGDCMNGYKGIKQIFILTHNVYFHREVTFLSSRKSIQLLLPRTG